MTTAEMSRPQGGLAGGWLMLLGALAIALGFIGLFMAFALTVAGAVWYGALLLVLGAAHLVHAFKEREGRWANVLLGAVYALGGAIMLANPVSAALTLTLLVGLVIAALGVARIVWAFGHHGAGRKLIGIVAGLISIALGWMIIEGWPATGLWVLGTLIAADLIVHGFTLLGAGWRRR